MTTGSAPPRRQGKDVSSVLCEALADSCVTAGSTEKLQFQAGDASFREEQATTEKGRAWIPRPCSWAGGAVTLMDQFGTVRVDRHRLVSFYVVET